MRRVLAVVPAVVISGGLALVALLAMIGESVGIGDPSGQVPAGLGSYRQLLADPAFPGALGFSLLVAVAGTALATGGALVVVWFQVTRPGRGPALALHANLAVAHLVWAVALAATLSQSGLLARVAHAAGVVDRPADVPVVVGDRHGVGIVIHLVTKELPFLVVVLSPIALRRAPPLMEQAALLGAGAWARLRLVLLPTVAPALVPASVVSFAFALGAYEPGVVLGTQTPRTLAVVALERFRDPDLVQRAEAQALSVLLVLLVGAFAVTVWRLSRRWVQPS